VTTQGIATSNTGAQNSAALTTLVGASGTAANGSVIFFPAGIYQFNGAVTVGTKSIFSRESVLTGLVLLLLPLLSYK